MFCWNLLLHLVLNVCVPAAIQLYTLTTIILVLQTIYYDRLNALWRRDRVRSVDDLFPEVSSATALSIALIWGKSYFLNKLAISFEGEGLT